MNLKMKKLAGGRVISSQIIAIGQLRRVFLKRKWSSTTYYADKVEFVSIPEIWEGKYYKGVYREKLVEYTIFVPTLDKKIWKKALDHKKRIYYEN